MDPIYFNPGKSKKGRQTNKIDRDINDTKTKQKDRISKMEKFN